MRMQIWNKSKESLLGGLVWICGLASMAVFLFLVAYILVKGLPHIKPGLFALEYTSENVSLMPALFSTLLMTALALAISIPLGLASAIYLVEYANKNGRLVRLIRITCETLSGIPSIVYGLFGMLFFVNFWNMGFSVAAGALTLSIMILPLIQRASEEALLSVPEGYREASFGLGAGRLRTIFAIVLPAAAPGIWAGVVLGVGRILGETAALIYTAGTVAKIPSHLGQSARTLAVHMYSLSSEGLHMGEAYATAALLLFVVIGMNSLSAHLAKGMGGGR